MAQREPIANMGRSEDYGVLQRLVDDLFKRAEFVRRLDVVILAEAYDLPRDLMEIIELLPSGTYARTELCVQLNSAIAGHAWGQVYGTVE